MLAGKAQGMLLIFKDESFLSWYETLSMNSRTPSSKLRVSHLPGEGWERRGRIALLLGFGNFSFCERERQTYLVGIGMLPCFLSLNIKFLPLILPLLCITLNTSWKPKPLEDVLKAETYAIPTWSHAAGWAQITDDCSSLPQFPAEAFQKVPAVLFIRDDE